MRSKQKTLITFTQYLPRIDKLEKRLQKLPDHKIRQLVQMLKQSRVNMTTPTKPPEANHRIKNSGLILSFAVVREAMFRVLGLRYFDVQILGGLLLSNSNAVEMSTGEGKTLVAVLPAFFNALRKKSVHVVTVNEYLAKRDALLVAPIYQFLGLRVGLVTENLSSSQKKN